MSRYRDQTIPKGIHFNEYGLSASLDYCGKTLPDARAYTLYVTIFYNVYVRKEGYNILISGYRPI